MVPETTTMMLRASALIGLSPAMLFVGVYKTDTNTAIALVDKDNVQINPDADECGPRTFDFNIEPHQVQAIVRHIKTRGHPFMRINIAGLYFGLLRNGNGCVTGVSNFNMDYGLQNTRANDQQTLLSISHKQFKSEELLEGVHALQLSAMLKDEIIVIGLCTSGSQCSSLKLIQEILEDCPEQPSENISIPAHGEKKIGFTTKSMSLRASLKSFSSLSEHGAYRADTMLNSSQDSILSTGAMKGSVGTLLDSLDMEEEDISNQGEFCTVEFNVERRASAKTPEEKRREQMKRETEFCEDWRTATMKSIEALRNIGTFPGDDHDDESPLIENIETTSDSRSVGYHSDNERSRRPSESKLQRKRPSRSTFV